MLCQKIPVVHIVCQKISVFQSFCHIISVFHFFRQNISVFHIFRTLFSNAQWRTHTDDMAEPWSSPMVYFLAPAPVFGLVPLCHGSVLWACPWPRPHGFMALGLQESWAHMPHDGALQVFFLLPIWVLSPIFCLRPRETNFFSRARV